MCTVQFRSDMRSRTLLRSISTRTIRRWWSDVSDAAGETIEVDDLPWTTAPEHAEEAMRELNVTEGSATWENVIRITTQYGLEDTLGDFYPTPSSLAAGAIYLCCRLENEPRCQRTVAGAVGVSNMAIRKSYHAIIETEGIDVDVSSGPRSRYSSDEAVRWSE